MSETVKHCCEEMAEEVNCVCEQHPHRFECPDALLNYNAKFDEYGIIIHDGGPSVRNISNCPFCGTKLPESQREHWFSELQAKGIEHPFDADIPEAYKSGEWRTQGSNK